MGPGVAPVPASAAPILPPDDLPKNEELDRARERVKERTNQRRELIWGNDAHLQRFKKELRESTESCGKLRQKFKTALSQLNISGTDESSKAKLFQDPTLTFDRLLLQARERDADVLPGTLNQCFELFVELGKEERRIKDTREVHDKDFALRLAEVSGALQSAERALATQERSDFLSIVNTFLHKWEHATDLRADQLRKAQQVYLSRQYTTFSVAEVEAIAKQAIAERRQEIAERRQEVRRGQLIRFFGIPATSLLPSVGVPLLLWWLSSLWSGEKLQTWFVIYLVFAAIVGLIAAMVIGRRLISSELKKPLRSIVYVSFWATLGFFFGAGLGCIVRLVGGWVVSQPATWPEWALRGGACVHFIILIAALAELAQTVAKND